MLALQSNAPVIAWIRDELQGPIERLDPREVLFPAADNRTMMVCGFRRDDFVGK